MPKSLLRLEVAGKKGMQNAIKKMSNILYQKMKERAGETDHSLEDLEELGHPYSTRNPKIIHDPSYTVHRQTDSLYNAIEIKGVNQYLTKVGVNEDKAPHVIDVVFGTQILISRDFITGSLREIEPEIKSIVEEMLNEQLKQ